VTGFEVTCEGLSNGLFGEEWSASISSLDGDLDAAVGGHFVDSRGSGTAISTTDGPNARWVCAAFDQPGNNRFGTALRECLVGLWRASMVGVAGHGGRARGRDQDGVELRECLGR
jgi:hypothetical protein